MNIFKGKLDCILYLILILGAPLLQCILLKIKADNLFYITAILMSVGIIYDAYGRYRKDASLKTKRTTVIIGIIGAYLSIVLAVLGCIVLFNGVFPDWCLLLYLPMVFLLVYAVLCLFTK